MAQPLPFSPTEHHYRFYLDQLAGVDRRHLWTLPAGDVQAGRATYEAVVETWAAPSLGEPMAVDWSASDSRPGQSAAGWEGEPGMHASRDPV